MLKNFNSCACRAVTLLRYCYHHHKSLDVPHTGTGTHINIVVFFFNQSKVCVFLPIVHGGACVALGIPFRPGNTAATLYQCFLASGTSVPVGCNRFRLTKTTKVTSHSRRPAINTHNYTTIKSLFLSDFHHSGSACG